MNIDYDKHPEQHPFFCGKINGKPFYAMSADDRIYKVKSFTKRQCIAAVELPMVLQKTVLKAIRSRMMELNRGQQ